MVSVQRMKRSIERGGKKFLDRVFTCSEQSYCEPKRMKYEHYAARMAAKEAVIKILNQSSKAACSYKEIEILKKPTGKPWIQLNAALEKKLKLPKKYQLEISMSHERKYAIANAVLVI